MKDTISLAELEEGDALDTQRIDAIVAFLKTLTDARYEPLLAEQEMAQKNRLLALAFQRFDHRTLGEIARALLCGCFKHAVCSLSHWQG